jgi:hypothetical protein
VPPIADDAERDAPLAAEVERLEREPFAAAFGRVESIQREALGLLRRGRR